MRQAGRASVWSNCHQFKCNDYIDEMNATTMFITRCYVVAICNKCDTALCTVQYFQPRPLGHQIALYPCQQVNGI